MYKHSWGHYWTQHDANIAKGVFEKKHEVELQVVKEKRQSNKLKKWCVCSFYPEKGKSAK